MVQQHKLFPLLDLKVRRFMLLINSLQNIT